MIALKRQGVPLSRDVILVANADEETNSSGAEWFAREKTGLLRDAEFLLNEGGHNRLGPEGQTEYYGVGVTEKVPYWVRITARGSPGHGSIPRPDNAAARISRALGRIAAYQTPIRLTPPAERYFKDLATRETDPGQRRWLGRPGGGARNPGAVRYFTSNLYYNAILRNTISITALHGSDKTNVDPARGQRRARRAAPAGRAAGRLRARAAPGDRRLRGGDHAAPPGAGGHHLAPGRRPDGGDPGGGGDDGAGRADHHADADGLHRQLLLPRDRHRGLRARARSG